MIFVLFLAAAAPSGPTLAEITSMTPAEAGRTLLAGKAHGRVIAVSRKARRSMDPPGWVEIELIEEAQLTDAGCTRRRWTGSFMFGPGETGGDASFKQVFPVYDVALPRARRCDQLQFAQANSIQPSLALEVLRAFDGILKGTHAVTLTCRSEVRTAPCPRKKNLRSELGLLTIDVVNARNGQAELWLSMADNLYTSIEFGIQNPKRVRVERKIPDPF